MKTSHPRTHFIVASVGVLILAGVAWNAAIAQRPTLRDPAAVQEELPSRFGREQLPPSATPDATRPNRAPQIPGSDRPYMAPQYRIPSPVQNPGPGVQLAHPPHLPNPNMKMVPRVRQVIEYATVSISPEEQRRNEQLRAAIAVLNDESKEDTKELQQAKAKIKKLLEDAFDKDMETREDQLTELEMKVEKLRQSFERRVESRDEIIQHRIRGFELEAAGLGFPGPGTTPHHVVISPRGTQIITEPAVPLPNHIPSDAPTEQSRPNRDPNAVGP